MSLLNEKRVPEKMEEEQYTLLDALPQFVWISRPDGSIVYTNQRWRDYNSLLPQHAVVRARFQHQHCDDSQPMQDRQHMLPHPDSLSEEEIWHQNIHHEDKERALVLQHQAFATGEPYQFEYRLWDERTSAYRWFLSQSVPLRNKTGQIVQWLRTSTDIDEQKRAQEALRQSQERVNVLMNSSMIGINIIEGEQIVDANDTFLNMTGYTREDLRAGRLNVIHMTHPEDRVQTQQVHQELATQQSITYEKEYVCKDGKRLPVLVGGALLQHHPLQGIAFVLDNSAHKELEQRRDALLGMVSHELKAPLTSLKLQTQLLRKKLKKQDLPNMEIACVRIETQLNAMNRLVDELLDLSRIQAGKLEYTQDACEIDKILEEAIKFIQDTHTGHTIMVHHTSSPAIVVGDRDRLARVFLNVLSNAIKYAPDAPLIDVELTTSAETVTISVRDHGIGIPRELQGRIFERFYRAVSLQQRAFPGLGMGLYIVAEIVKHHGGTIRVDSEMGKGTTIHLTFPLATSQNGVFQG